MDIKGLDYNTQRERLVLPEYGREIQAMVDIAVKQPTKALRQSAAEAVVKTMERMFPQNRVEQDYKHKLWDHLAVMSNFQLDIDWPYDIGHAVKMAQKPQPMAYPMSRIPVRHYGKLVFELFEKLKQMPDGEERDCLVAMTANQMRRDLYEWSHGSTDDEKVADDLEHFTDGAVRLDLSRFQFEKLPKKEPEPKKRKRR